MIQPLYNPCMDSAAPFRLQPWCNATLPVDVRVGDMIKRMSLQEKFHMLDTDGPAIASLGLNAYNFWSEAAHGISHVNASGVTPASTNFAMPITTAAAFNRSLWRATGAAIAREARAFMNAGHAYSTYWAPVINLAREPRWGRNLECAGEDPVLAGEYAVAFVTAFEHLDEEPHYLAASACCKHLAANSMENTVTAKLHHTRYSANPNITTRDLVDTYLAPFQMCVEVGRVSSLMCSYNAFNGIPSCANRWLLETVARKAWGFAGYITSDCAAVGNIVSPHHYVDDNEEAVAATLHAGMDVACAHFNGQHGPAALKRGLIDESLIDTHLANLFKVRMRLQHFDAPGPLQRIMPAAACTSEAAAIAREGAAQGAILLKNVHDALPLDMASLGSLAVIGPNANLSEAIAGYYGSKAVCGGVFWSMIDALAEALPAGAPLHHAPGVPNVLSEDTSSVSAAAALAKTAERTVLVLGTDLSVARENRDAVNLTFSAGQLALVEAVAKAAPSPVVVVTLTAVPLDLTPLLNNANIGAILHAGQPSVQTRGIVDVLRGVTSPAGRAIQTVYPESYQHMISPFDFNMRPGPSAWPRPDSPGPCADPNPSPAGRPQPPPIVPSADCKLGTNPGRTYRFFNGSAVIPFGYGLSYTTFTYHVAQAPRAAVSLTRLDNILQSSRAATGTEFPKLEAMHQPAAEYLVNVTNTGARDADDVVLGFIELPGAGTDGRPIKSLFGFERVHVRAGTTVSVWLSVPLGAFAAVGADGVRRVVPGRYVVSLGVHEGSIHGMGFARASLWAM